VIDAEDVGAGAPRSLHWFGVSRRSSDCRHPSGMTRPLSVRDGGPPDHADVVALLIESWGSTTVVSRGRVHDAGTLPAKVATCDGSLVGLATFHLEADERELVTLDSTEQGHGIGSALLAAVAKEAVRRGAHRLWLVTSNDNLDALRFYQRRGIRLCAIHRDAIDQARLVKPSIPLVGNFGIAIRDELELELRLNTANSEPRHKPSGSGTTSPVS
jgi:GNAT superfamily N-acetyltransferase